MKTFIRNIYRLLTSYGFNAKHFLSAIKARRGNWIKKDYKELKRQKGDDNTFILEYSYPILIDKFDEGGTMKGAYFHQDLYVAKKIFSSQPQNHLDIGSRVDGFVAHVASYREIEIMDIRPIKSKVANITFRQANLMELPIELVGKYDSISSLHAIEHFGLGRYGDPIDYWGHVKALANISKILKEDGIFYFSVPIGLEQRIEFNGQRIFSVAYLQKILSEHFETLSFSYVNDEGDFFEEILLSETDARTSFNCFCGCGIFVLKKKRSAYI
ncbi:MAG: DUF268 domain-containing protein [Chitinophagales bacterium]|nr:DUF268 domain-containing protein [Chitinophagales bacterium]